MKNRPGRGGASRARGGSPELDVLVHEECRRRFESFAGVAWSERHELAFCGCLEPVQREAILDREHRRALQPENSEFTRRLLRAGREEREQNRSYSAAARRLLPALERSAKLLASALREATELAKEAPLGGEVLPIAHTWARVVAPAVLPALEKAERLPRAPPERTGWAFLVHLIDVRAVDVGGIGRKTTTEEFAVIGLLIGLRVSLNPREEFTAADAIDQARKHVSQAIKRHGRGTDDAERVTWKRDGYSGPAPKLPKHRKRTE